MASAPPPGRNPQPSFEFEDGTLATPSASDPAPASTPVFNPFADQPVSVGPVAPPPSSTPGSGQAPPPLAAPGVPVDETAASKDLWYCPHCGCGNQKKRDLCRACGKSPREPVVKPWIRTVPGMAVSGGAALLLLIGMLTWCSTDKSLHPAGPAGLDHKVRTWGGLSDVSEDLGNNRTFTRRGMLAVSGRVVAAKSISGYPWITTVILALGKETRADRVFNNWSATLSENNISSSAPSYVVLHCLFPEDGVTLVPGSWLSLIGARGSVTDESAKLVPFTTDRSHFVVKVQGHKIMGNEAER